MSITRRIILALTVLALLVGLYFGSIYIALGGRVVAQGTATEREIALTFDDGPNALWTPRILAILAKYNAKATFFVIGANVQRHPETANLIVEQGNQIANHSQSHSEFLPYLTPGQIVEDYKDAEQAINNATGLSPRFYRAPHGKLTPWMRQALKSQGLIIVGWSSSPGDWRKSRSAEEITSRVLNAARPGAIILLHDGLDLSEDPDKSQLVQALPGIIEQLQSQGYKLVIVAQLLGEKPYF
jgi:peptidoglycan/xylan/chitin deacetylase (PgdA/CDA1 family)